MAWNRSDVINGCVPSKIIRLSPSNRSALKNAKSSQVTSLDRNNQYYKLGKDANTNLLLTEREGRTGEYWPEVVTVRTERSEVRAKTTEGQYSPVRLEQARLVSSLLYGIISLAERTLPVVSFKSTSGVMSAM